MKSHIKNPDKVKFEFVLLMATMASVLALAIDTILPAMDIISAELSLTSLGDTQYLISILFIGFGVGQLLFGPMSDSVGRKKPIYLGGIIFGIGCLVSYFSQDFQVMLIGRFLQGFGAAAFRTISIAIIRDEYSGVAMAKTMSLVMSVFILVPALAPSLGQLILFVSPWRSIFLMFFWVCFITLVWFFLRQKETLPLNMRKNFSLNLIWRGVVETCKNPTSLSATLISGFVFGGFIAYLSCSQQIFQNLYGVGTKFPLYFGGLALTVGFAAFTNSNLVIRFGIIKIITFSLQVMFFVSLIFFSYLVFFNVSVPPIELLMIYLSIFFCGIGFLFGNLNTLALSPLGHIAGVASSVIGSIQNFVSVLVGVLIATQFTDSLVPIVMGFLVLSLLSLLILLVYKKYGR